MNDPGALSFHLMGALGAALLGASVAVRLRQSIVLGYILAGIVIGPFTPGPTGRVDVIEQLAEIGVVLLLFVLGAQLSLRELLRAGRLALLGALLQVLVMVGIGYAFARVLGFGAAEAFAGSRPPRSPRGASRGPCWTSSRTPGSASPGRPSRTSPP